MGSRGSGGEAGAVGDKVVLPSLGHNVQLEKDGVIDVLTNVSTTY